MAENSLIEKLRALGERAEKDADLNIRLKTDLDGALRDEGFDVEEAKKALAELADQRMNTMKTMLDDL
jgi:hypothetical protein